MAAFNASRWVCREMPTTLHAWVTIPNAFSKAWIIAFFCTSIAVKVYAPYPKGLTSYPGSESVVNTFSIVSLYSVRS